MRADHVADASINYFHPLSYPNKEETNQFKKIALGTLKVISYFTVILPIIMLIIHARATALTPGRVYSLPFLKQDPRINHIAQRSLNVQNASPSNRDSSPSLMFRAAFNTKNIGKGLLLRNPQVCDLFGYDRIWNSNDIVKGCLDLQLISTGIITFPDIATMQDSIKEELFEKMTHCNATVPLPEREPQRVENLDEDVYTNGDNIHEESQVGFAEEIASKLSDVYSHLTRENISRNIAEMRCKSESGYTYEMTGVLSRSLPRFLHDHRVKMNLHLNIRVTFFDPVTHT